MINLHENYVVELVFKPATPGHGVRHATDCAMKPSTLSDKQRTVTLRLIRGSRLLLILVGLYTNMHSEQVS